MFVGVLFTTLDQKQYPRTLAAILSSAIVVFVALVTFVSLTR